MELKVFVITYSNGNEVYIAAHSNLVAIQTYLNFQEIYCLQDLSTDDSLTEVSHEKWADISVLSDGAVFEKEELISIEKWVLKNPNGGYIGIIKP